jgi:aspartate kinase
MALIVQKYGGTSVGSVERIRNVARRVARYHRDGHQLVVVVSAMAGETNRLLGLAKELASDPNPRELDVVAATGEQVTIGLLAIALDEMGHNARSYTGGQIRVLTDSAHTKARILSIDEEKIRADLAAGTIVIVAGFQGVDATATSRHSAGAARTRRGSRSPPRSKPTSARSTPTSTASTRRIRGSFPKRAGSTPSPSRKCWRWRASAPRCCRSARSSSPGSTTSSCACSRRSTIRNPAAQGTLITFEEDETMEQAIISGIAFNRDEAKISVMGVEDRPGVAYGIVGPIAEANIDVDMIVQNIGASGHTDFSFTVNRSEYKQRSMCWPPNAARASKRARSSATTVSARFPVVGIGMRSHVGIASKMFKALADEGINIQMISTSEIKISIVIDEKYLELAVRVLHRAFELDREPQAM